MATTKAATKKAAPKKAAKSAVKKAVKPAVVKAETTEVETADLKTVEGPIQFNVKQAKNIDMIAKNQFRIQKAASNILDIAADSGMRLLALKDVVKGHGHNWKDWCGEGNLPLSYEQVNRYCKLAAHPKELAAVKDKGVTGIAEAVKQIEYIKKPEKQEVAEKKAAVKVAAVKAKTVPASLNAAFDILEGLDLSDLRQIQGYIAERIEELTQAEVDAGEDTDGEFPTVGDDDGTAAAMEHASNNGGGEAAVDPLS